MNNTILCIGEVLWDAMPAGLFLGGAPFNVACHLHMLGEDVAFVSRVGDDVLGREVLRRMQMRGMEVELVQVDPAWATGFVEVTLGEAGVPDYVIREPAAWDAIALTDALHERASQARAIIFGSLAQRRETSRRTIRALEATEATRIFDVNLRPPFVDRDIVNASLRLADVIKLNDDELFQIVRWWGLPVATHRAGAEALAARFGLETVCITRGAAGAALWKNGAWWEHAGYTVTVKDTVGAGDAFLAGLLHKLLAGEDEEAVLAFACRLGAFVATRSGATPAYEADALAEISTLAS